MFFVNKVLRFSHAMEQSSGKPKGFGYVEFSTRDDLVKALSLSGHVSHPMFNLLFVKYFLAKTMEGRIVEIDVSVSKSSGLVCL